MKWYRISGLDEFNDELDCLVQALDGRDLLRIIENNDYLSNSKIYCVKDELVEGTIPSERWGWWWMCDIRFYTTEIDEEKRCRYLIQAQNVEEVSRQVKEQVREQIGPCGIDGLQRLKLGSVLSQNENEEQEKEDKDGKE